MLIAAAIDGIEKRVDVREDHRLRPTDELVFLQLGSERGGFGEIRARLTPVEGKGFETSPHRFSRLAATASGEMAVNLASTIGAVRGYTATGRIPMARTSLCLKGYQR